MDFELARFNMIEQQIRPWEVLDQDILDTLMVVKRELFAPPACQAMAFSDLEIPLNLDGLKTGEVMFTPKVEARMLQALKVHRHESVVEVGAGSGYMAALLAHRAARVVTLELHPELAAFARANLHRAGIDNCELVCRNGVELIDDDSIKADILVLSGAVAKVPESLFERLAPGGRLLAVVGQSPVMTATLFTKSDSGQVSSRNLFETLTRPLVGFPVTESFSF
jgi:protein-L-isoaspartate(D-aspartate) O-methyltransferase